MEQIYQVYKTTVNNKIWTIRWHQTYLWREQTYQVFKTTVNNKIWKVRR